jgi:hypothetical protein
MWINSALRSPVSPDGHSGGRSVRCCPASSGNQDNGRGVPRRRALRPRPGGPQADSSAAGASPRTTLSITGSPPARSSCVTFDIALCAITRRVYSRRPCLRHRDRELRWQTILAEHMFGRAAAGYPHFAHWPRAIRGEMWMFSRSNAPPDRVTDEPGQVLEPVGESSAGGLGDPTHGTDTAPGCAAPTAPQDRLLADP